jgi:spermidine/putrescine transport system ATP-binding protein
MTGPENVVCDLRVEGVAACARRARAGRLLERLHPSALADRRPAQLPGGQRFPARLFPARLRNSACAAMPDPGSALSPHREEGALRLPAD